jgi:hypothetical protein
MNYGSVMSDPMKSQNPSMYIQQPPVMYQPYMPTQQLPQSANPMVYMQPQMQPPFMSPIVQPQITYAQPIINTDLYYQQQQQPQQQSIYKMQQTQPDQMHPTQPPSFDNKPPNDADSFLSNPIPNERRQNQPTTKQTTNIRNHRRTNVNAAGFS